MLFDLVHLWIILDFVYYIQYFFIRNINHSHGGKANINIHTAMTVIFVVIVTSILCMRKFTIVGVNSLKSVVSVRFLAEVVYQHFAVQLFQFLFTVGYCFKYNSFKKYILYKMYLTIPPTIFAAHTSKVFLVSCHTLFPSCPRHFLCQFPVIILFSSIVIISGINHINNASS